MSVDGDLATLPLITVAEGIASGALSPVDVVDAVLERVDRIDPLLSSYVTLDADGARASAEAASAAVRVGAPLGPLHGVPLSVKDVLHHGLTRAGSLAPLPRRSGDGSVAVAVARLEQAGAIVLGKAATYEFALGAQTLTGPFAPTRNPWDPAMDAGGSSSGSAAGVAACLSYASLGSDTAGSARYPAAACGVVGLKPSYDLVSRVGLVPLSFSLDHVGIITRNVADAARVLAAQVEPAARAALLDLAPPVRPLRLGIPQRLFRSSCDASVLAVFERSCEVLRDAGVEVVDVEVTADMLDVAAALWPILLAEMAAAHHDGLLDPAAAYGRQVRSTMEAGFLVTGVDYLRAQQLRRTIAADVLEALGTVDHLVLPTSSALPGPVLTEPPASDEYASGENVRVFTAIANLTGGPAITLPCGAAPDGLPLGLQLLGRPGDDAAVLRTARRVAECLAVGYDYASLPRTGS